MSHWESKCDMELKTNCLGCWIRSLKRFSRWSWWRHQMETFSALLALCAGNPPVTGEFPSQRPATRSFYFFYLRLIKQLSKQSRHWWFETPSLSLVIVSVLEISLNFCSNTFSHRRPEDYMTKRPKPSIYITCYYITYIRVLHTDNKIHAFQSTKRHPPFKSYYDVS